jgi:uncharacterized protein YndB with AHSA1/START domain
VSDSIEINHAVFISAAPENVYEAFTTPEGLDGWFTTGAQIDPRPGGKILFRWTDWGPDDVTGEDGGPVLEAQAPKYFVFQWYPDNPTYPTTVEIKFQAAVDNDGTHGTIVRLREYGYQRTPSGLEACINCATGWGEALTLLKFYVEHNIRY